MVVCGLLLLVAALVCVPGDAAAAALRRRAVLVGAHRVSRRRGRAGGADRFGTASAFDLLAACLRAGLPVGVAARAVASIAPPELGTALHRVADLLALGADQPDAWRRVAQEAGSADIQALARMAARSARSGACLADAVSELAGQCRAAVEDAAAARAERAGVLIGGPLGLCFLPAFVCLGIVPVVIGLATRVLGGGL
ncbi:type II secretion system F family protein [Nocardia sp. CA2R105]|uniref:type II secretion system F family protein n=1 Tax=Nocardia coffeae TaxID=2873381 RepID=UPI001CA61947|nr:type II secretion system F family protein [Nocardia coffeae]MBY8855837.1 type II secretion system F family protein [Nocardia coffeae]